MYAESTRVQADSAPPPVCNPVVQVAIISPYVYYVIIIEKLEIYPSVVRSELTVSTVFTHSLGVFVYLYN